MPLCRCVRPGATVLLVDAPDGIRALAARHPDGAWTLVAVNRRAEPVTVRWRGALPATPMRRWTYAPGDLAVDAAGMPAATAPAAIDAAAGVLVDLPADAVVVLSAVE
jgi:hypothetical protein